MFLIVSLTEYDLLEKETLFPFIIYLNRWDPVKVGHERIVDLGDDRNYLMRTLATKPPLFEIENFLSSSDCERIKELSIEVLSTLTVHQFPDFNPHFKSLYQSDSTWVDGKVNEVDSNKRTTLLLYIR